MEDMPHLCNNDDGSSLFDDLDVRVAFVVFMDMLFILVHQHVFHDCVGLTFVFMHRLIEVDC